MSLLPLSRTLGSQLCRAQGFCFSLSGHFQLCVRGGFGVQVFGASCCLRPRPPGVTSGSSLIHVVNHTPLHLAGGSPGKASAAGCRFLPSAPSQM